ncbi:alpha/beta hydrolase [Bacillus sp. 28A-2]|uniref:alpha/beta family hydrolase n=1 Tax=Bacillus sp. 28A-2 TaxID=2772252 RepID=UPI00168D1340|nr:alpha/beta family hydrolase [Bacillus sp. 28A-2]MBD3859275.1 alpha/beta hydrolase [Bacillus sp. 28A-2]
MKKILKVTGITLLALMILAFGAFYTWSRFTYGPSEALKKQVAIEQVEHKNGVYAFEASKSDTGIILYPGAKVEPLAYAYIGEALMKKGYSVFIPDMPFSFAIFNTMKAHDIIKDHQSIKHWYIGGHSLGGTAAAMYAEKKQGTLDGLFFLASYPASDNLKQATLKVLSISAEKDGLATQEKIKKSKTNLPSQTVYHEINGGNHAQFGMYGKQKGDQPADISALTQQKDIIQTMLEWLKPAKKLP